MNYGVTELRDEWITLGVNYDRSEGRRCPAGGSPTCRALRTLHPPYQRPTQPTSTIN